MYRALILLLLLVAATVRAGMVWHPNVWQEDVFDDEVWDESEEFTPHGDIYAFAGGAVLRIPTNLATVPSVVTFTLAQAESDIATANLIVGLVTDQCSPEMMGLVVAQNPQGGAQVAPASIVDLWVSTGVECAGVIRRRLILPRLEIKP